MRTTYNRASAIFSCRGAGLMEVMVAVGVLGIIATMGLSLSRVATEQNRSAHLRSTADTVASKIQTAYEGNTACLAALKNNNFGTAEWLLGGAGLNIQMQVPGLGLCGDMFSSNTTGDCNVIPSLGLKIEKFQLRDGWQTPTVIAGRKEYVAKVVLQLSKQSQSKGGMAMRERLLGGILLTIEDGTNQLVDCRNTLEPTPEEICLALGPLCTYDIARDKPCLCEQSQIGCPLPGTYPVEIVNGIMSCVPLGGGNCPPGEILTGIYVGGIECTKVDAVAIEFKNASTKIIEGNAAAITLKISALQSTDVVATVIPEYTAEASKFDLTPNIAVSVTIPAGFYEGSFTATAVADTITETAFNPVEAMTFRILSFVGGSGIVFGNLAQHTVLIADTAAAPPPSCTVPGIISWPGGCSTSGGDILGLYQTVYKTDSVGPFTGAAEWECNVAGAPATMVPGSESCQTFFWTYMGSCSLQNGGCGAYVDIASPPGVASCPSPAPTVVGAKLKTPCSTRDQTDICMIDATNALMLKCLP